MRSRVLIALLALIVLVPGSALARVMCTPMQNECRDAKQRCILATLATMQCRAGKAARCMRAASRSCTAKIRKCCRRSPLDACCGADAYFTPTTTLPGGLPRVDHRRSRSASNRARAASRSSSSKSSAPTLGTTICAKTDSNVPPEASVPTVWATASVPCGSTAR